jgi:hypothetical protein
VLPERRLWALISPVEQLTNEIRVGYSDPDINDLLASIGERSALFTRHFSHAEEFFLKLENEFSVPRFPVHHDVRISMPEPHYRAALRPVIGEIAGLAPQVLKGLTYFFDPAEVLRPSFFQIFRMGESQFLYLLRLDLGMRSFGGTVTERGDNDFTAGYRTRGLFVEPVVLPLSDVVVRDGRTVSFRIRQTVSQTWIGERGRGYFVQGIWMDSDLTKFFSRLFLPTDSRTYPFFPFLCKYKTVCRSMIDLAPPDRRETVPDLQRAVDFLAPAMEEIQAALKDSSFEEDMPVFTSLKARVPEDWYNALRNVRITAYLNQAEMREFLVEN